MAITYEYIDDTWDEEWISLEDKSVWEGDVYAQLVRALQTKYQMYDAGDFEYDFALFDTSIEPYPEPEDAILDAVNDQRQITLFLTHMWAVLYAVVFSDEAIIVDGKQWYWGDPDTREDDEPAFASVSTGFAKLISQSELLTFLFGGDPPQATEYIVNWQRVVELIRIQLDNMSFLFTGNLEIAAKFSEKTTTRTYYGLNDDGISDVVELRISTDKRAAIGRAIVRGVFYFGNLANCLTDWFPEWDYVYSGIGIKEIVKDDINPDNDNEYALDPEVLTYEDDVVSQTIGFGYTSRSTPFTAPLYYNGSATSPQKWGVDGAATGTANSSYPVAEQGEFKIKGNAGTIDIVIRIKSRPYFSNIVDSVTLTTETGFSETFTLTNDTDSVVGIEEETQEFTRTITILEGETEGTLTFNLSRKTDPDHKTIEPTIQQWSNGNYIANDNDNITIIELEEGERVRLAVDPERVAIYYFYGTTTGYRTYYLYQYQIADSEEQIVETGPSVLAIESALNTIVPTSYIAAKPDSEVMVSINIVPEETGT